MPDVLVAKSSFSTVHDGQKVYVRAGATASPNHWLALAYPEAFKPLEVTFDAPAPPAAPAPKAVRRADQPPDVRVPTPGPVIQQQKRTTA